MDIFSTPAPAGSESPDHCPNEACPSHRPKAGWAYKKAGFFRRSSDGRKIQRFRCLECGRFFSSVTFATTYWLRLRHLLIPIAQLGIFHSTVARHIGRAARTSENPLFVINATDSFIRHSQANHRRETIAASKRRQMGLERLAVFMVWRNLVKRRFENGPDESSAMVAGWTDRRWGWGDGGLGESHGYVDVDLMQAPGLLLLAEGGHGMT